MREDLTPDENYRIERDESSLGRRDYLRLTGAAGVVGLGSSAFIGEASASDTEPKRTLTIEGRNVNAEFDFSVSGNVVKSTAMGASINSNDTISGQSVSGSVASGGRDSYSFSGELTSFSTNNDPLLYLNGEPLSDTVSIERNSGDEPVHYELRVDGEVLKSPGVFGTINASDEITPRDDPSDVEPMTDAEPLAGETYALGKVGNGTDSYSISGDITGFHSDGNVDLRVNGITVDNPAQFVRTTLTFERTDATKATYEFTTSEDVAKSRAMGATINDSDTIDGSSVTGKVTNGRDSYVFTGEITDFSGSDNLRVYMSRKEIDAATLSAEPEFENRLTIEGNGGYTVYKFAVEGNLAENYGVESSDILDGKTANGFVQNDQDSYTFSGDLSMVDIDPNVDASFRTYLNGAEVDPATLGNVQTTPDPEDLPNEVKIRALTDARTEYGFGVSGTLATGDRSNTYSGDNASYEYARGWVKDEGLDNYKFSGKFTTLTDFETFQIDIDYDEQTIDIEDFGSRGQTDYEITVSGEMSKTPSSSASTVSGGTATGGIDGGTDVYEFTGLCLGIKIQGIVETIAAIDSEILFQDGVNRATVIRKESDDIQNYFNSLDSDGIKLARRDRLTPFINYGTNSSSGSVSTEGLNRIESDDIDITMSILTDADDTYYYAELSWTYDQDWNFFTGKEHGAAPADIGGISYNENWWKIRDQNSIKNSTSTSEYVSYRDGTNGGNGLAFEIHDAAIAPEILQGVGHPSHCGIYLEPLGDFDPEDRRVYGDYVHTWRGGTISGVSVSFPAGLSLSAGLIAKAERTDTEIDGDTPLVVDQEEALNNLQSL